MPIGQADSPASIDDIAELIIADNSQEPAQDEDQPLPDSDETEQTLEDPADEPLEDSEEAEEQPSLTFKVTIKGEDGTDQTLEVDQKELVNGYQRHADYTRKTQELATREREVTQAVAQRLQEGQSYYMQQAQLAQQTIAQLAGLRSPQEMAALAQTDPATWVAEQQREQQIGAVMQQLQKNIQQEKANREEYYEIQKAQAFDEGWKFLRSKGIDEAQGREIGQKAVKVLGLTSTDLENLYNPRYVLMMRDAIAYRELQANKQTVTKKAEQAPRLPATRQQTPKQVQQTKALNGRFASGKAKLSDLAAYLSN